MIPITCPTCGRRGTIPSDRLNTRMHCKKCDAVFHMDKSGKIMLGEPGAAKAAKGGPPGKSGGAAGKGGKPAQRARKKEEVSISSPAEFIAAIPIWGKVGIVVAALVVVLFVSGVFTPRVADPTLNYKNFKDDIDSRFRFLAHMFADNQPGEIRRIATSESANDVSKWMELVRPMFKFDAPERPGSRCDLRVRAIEGDGKTSDTAIWTAIIVPPLPYTGPEVEAERKARTPKDAATPGYDATGMFELPTYWVRKGKQWQLDAKRSLEEAQKRLSAKK